MGVSGGLAVAGLAWGPVLLFALPRGLGQFILPNLWRPTYPLVLPLTISIVGGCVSAGAGCGLHALGAANRSLRAMVLGSAVYVICGVTGAAVGGVHASMMGIAVAGWVGAAFFWVELRAALRNSRSYRAAALFARQQSADAITARSTVSANNQTGHCRAESAGAGPCRRLRNVVNWRAIACSVDYFLVIVAVSSNFLCSNELPE